MEGQTETLSNTYALHITSFRWSRCTVFTSRALIDPLRNKILKTYLDSQELIVQLGTEYNINLKSTLS
jgi:hypothetical protein